MTTAIPESPTARLRRKATAEALLEKGFPVSEKTLATKAVRGGGPPYQRSAVSCSTAGQMLWHGPRAGLRRHVVGLPK